LVFDNVRNRILLFGGWSPTVGNNADVWEYDGADWTLVTPSPGGPPTNWTLQGDATFDAARGKLLVIYEDGFHPDPPTNKTWEFDSASATWQLAYTGVGPSYAYSPVAFDASRGFAVGQYVSLSQGNKYTWTYAGAAWSLSGATTPERHYPALAYDATRKRATLFGSGRDIGQPSSWHSDTYAFDGATWSLVLPEFHNNVPGGAFPPSMMTFDSRRRAMVLVSNNYAELSQTVPVQTWEYRYLDQATFDRGPASVIAEPGATVHFRVWAAGHAPLEYQWRRNNANLANGPGPRGSFISGATSRELIITNAGLDNTGEYSVVVANGCGSRLSETATLRIDAAAPLPPRPIGAGDGP